MAGARKVAVLANLMLALLISASLVDAARPVIEEGSIVAADGRAMVRREGRGLRMFFGWTPWSPCYSHQDCAVHPYFGYDGRYGYPYKSIGWRTVFTGKGWNTGGYKNGGLDDNGGLSNNGGLDNGAGNNGRGDVRIRNNNGRRLNTFGWGWGGWGWGGWGGWGWGGRWGYWGRK